jgi:hypothetical protein
LAIDLSLDFGISQITTAKSLKFFTLSNSALLVIEQSKVWRDKGGKSFQYILFFTHIQ